MDHRYAVHEIDPETVHLIGVDVPFVEHLQGLGHQALMRARRFNKYVTIHQDVDAPEPTPENPEPKAYEALAYRDYEADFFERGYIQCPREADLEFQEQNNRPRPFPSTLVTPTGQMVVSKPGLCDGCVHRLQRGVNNHCYGLQFTPLTELT